MPTKIYRIKINDFWINVSYSPPHYPRQKTKKSNVPKMSLILPVQITTSPIFKITEPGIPFHRAVLSEHFNSLFIQTFNLAAVRNHVHNTFALHANAYCERIRLLNLNE